MEFKKIKEVVIPITIFLIGLFLIFYYTIKGVVVFDIDVARDFLLMEGIIAQRHLTLIGARTAIDGLFHGPFWLYLNLPVFFISNGNPVASGWFWLFLFFCLLASIHFIGNRLYNKKTTVLALSIITSQALFFIKSPTNPFGAFIIFPVYFYLLVEYLRRSKPFYLLILLLLGGILIQSEMVFGIPVVLASVILITNNILVKSKKIKHFLIFPILLLPLITFVVFELSHYGLQTNALIRYISKSGSSLINLFKINYLLTALQGCRFFLSSPHNVRDIFPGLGNIVSFLSIAFLYIFSRGQKNIKERFPLKIFLFLYVFFWLILSLTRNTIYWYYYWAFAGIAAVFLSAAAHKNKLIYLIVVCGISLNMLDSVKYLSESSTKRSFWKTQQEYAKDIFNSAPEQFGYFINTLDQISGNIPLYALIYQQRFYKDKKATMFNKQKYTYIITGSYPDGKPMDSTWWIKNRLHIQTKPTKRLKYKSGYTVELYMLSDKEQEIKSEDIFDPMQYR